MLGSLLCVQLSRLKVSPSRRFSSQISISWGMVDVASVSNHHNSVFVSWNWICAYCLSSALRAACPQESRALAAFYRKNQGPVNVTPRND